MGKSEPPVIEGDYTAVDREPRREPFFGPPAAIMRFLLLLAVLAIFQFIFRLGPQ